MPTEVKFKHGRQISYPATGHHKIKGFISSFAEKMHLSSPSDSFIKVIFNSGKDVIKASCHKTPNSLINWHYKITRKIRTVLHTPEF